jgi:uncharacterized protein (DUF433 family)
VIVKTPGTCGGRPRVAGTRLEVSLISYLAQLGWSVNKMLEAYPQLSRQDVLEALTYAANHMDELRDVSDQ